MAYVLTRTQIGNGDVSYNISSAQRIPGTHAQKRVTVEKYSALQLAAEGKDPEAFVHDRLQKLRLDLRERREGRLVPYHIDLGLLLSGGPKPDDQRVNLGYAAYSRLYHMFEIDEFANNRRRRMRCEYNLNVMLQHLLYSRMLWPDSKLDGWERRGRFFGGGGYALEDVYRAMDKILPWRTALLRHLDKMAREKLGRRGNLVYYDVTNYYFERDGEDEEGIGLRAKGVSKEHRPEPIIQMGLFMDELGLPVSYELFRGNANDCTTLIPAMEDGVVDFSGKRRIIVADKGMMSYKNVLKIRSDRNGYVVSQSIRKSDDETKAFALSDEGWEVCEVDKDTGVVQMRLKDRLVLRDASATSDVDGKRHSGKYRERQVFVWSRKHAERAREERNKVLLKASSMVGRKSSDFKDSSYGAVKYLSKTPMKGGKPLDADGGMYTLDAERIKEEEKYDGYYLICTNVVGTETSGKKLDGKPDDHAYYCSETGFLVLNHNVTAAEIRRMYGGLWRIEQTFKVTKTGMLNLRPVFHSRDDRIRAHFLLCFVALFLERVLELKLGWKYSAATIQQSLSSFSATLVPNSNYYLVGYFDQVVADVFSTLEIGVPHKFVSQLDVRQWMGETKKKDYD